MIVTERMKVWDAANSFFNLLEFKLFLRRWGGGGGGGGEGVSLVPPRASSFTTFIKEKSCLRPWVLPAKTSPEVSSLSDHSLGFCFLYQYLTYEECVKQAAAATGTCRRSNSSYLNVDKICKDFEQKLKKLCAAHCARG